MATSTGNTIDWQVGLCKISQRASKILETGQWSDCRFIVGTDERQQIIPSHKMILAMSSPVFEAMFFGSIAEKGDKPIEILDVQPLAFRSLLTYIYTDEVKFKSFDEVCEICYAAKKYMIPPLVQECTKYIWKDLHPGNVCRAYAFVKLFEEPLLLEKCMSMIKNMTRYVIRDKTFDEIDVATLRSILAEETLNINEIELWEGSMRWAKQECIRQTMEATSGNKRKVLEDVIPLFRFLTLAPNEFANGPAISGVLTQEECFNLLMNISAPGVSTLPVPFSCNTQHRKPPPESQQREYQQQERKPWSLDESRLLYEEESQIMHCNCTGPLVDSFYNDQLIDCKLSFSVQIDYTGLQQDISLIGVVLPTQLKPQETPQEIFRDMARGEQQFVSRPRLDFSGRGLCHNSNSRFNQINKYQELIYSFVQDSNGSRLTYTHFTSRVSWESTMEITFNRPVAISPKTTYEIVVVLNKIGRYPSFSQLPELRVDNAKFEFVGQPEGSSIVKTLILKTANGSHCQYDS